MRVAAETEWLTPEELAAVEAAEAAATAAAAQADAEEEEEEEIPEADIKLANTSVENQIMWAHAMPAPISAPLCRFAQ